MAEYIEVKVKYCDRCYKVNHCHTPCPLVLSALWDLPCEKEIYNICTHTKRKRWGEVKILDYFYENYLRTFIDFCEELGERHALEKLLAEFKNKYTKEGVGE